jgi:DHA1 family tetracycline resistance protein-like MFS transporter
VAGIFGASFAAAGAYIGDISNDENRARNFGFIGAAWGFGFTLGPAIGGPLAEHIDPRAPFFVAAALALANVAFGYFVLPESLPPERRRKFEWVRANPFGAFKNLAHLPMVAGLLFAVFPVPDGARFAAGRVDVLHAVPVRLEHLGDGLVAHLRGRDDGDRHGWLDRLIVPRIGERRAIIIGFLLMTVGFVGYALATQGWMLYVALAIGSLGGIANPAVQSVMSKQAGPSAQGELQGGVASINSIAAVLSPIFMTQLFRYYSDAGAPIHFPGAPYLVSAVFVFFCVLICARAVKMGTFLDS